MMIGDLSDCQLQSHSQGTHLPALQARHRGQYPPPPEGSERGSAPCRHTDLSADWRHLRPLAATRSAIWQPKQVKQNSEGGKKGSASCVNPTCVIPITACLPRRRF